MDFPGNSVVGLWIGMVPTQVGAARQIKITRAMRFFGGARARGRAVGRNRIRGETAGTHVTVVARMRCAAARRVRACWISERVCGCGAGDAWDQSRDMGGGGCLLFVRIGIEPDSGKVKGKQFFFEKKNQKTFARWGARWIERASQFAKVFASFFKRKRFLAC